MAWHMDRGAWIGAQREDSQMHAFWPCMRSGQRDAHVRALTFYCYMCPLPNDILKSIGHQEDGQKSTSGLDLI